jgi:protein ImuB
LPRLAVERLRVAGPVVVWRGVGSRREVVAVGDVPGVRVGQALSDAQAIAPGVLAVEADPAADAAFRERLALWAMRFTPLVAVAGEDALVLDVTGVEHLFGGEAALLRRVVEKLARLGVTAQGVVAGAPGTALALARAGVTGLVVRPGEEAEAVAELPLSVLPVTPEVVTSLSRMGLRRIGELRAQPRGPLARRFGAALLRTLEEAAGEVSAPISPIRPPPEFEAVREVLEPLVTREAIDVVVAALLRVLCRRLEEAGRGARRVVLRAHRVDGAVLEVTVGVGLASRDPAHLGRLFAERLERLEPGFGLDRFALAAEVTEEMAGAQGGFVRGVLEREELARLFDRLAQRVQVWRLAPAASNWPEREVVRVAATATVVIPEGWPRAPRPLRLLRRPLEVGAMALLPDMPPSLLRIGTESHRVRQAEGPERLEPEWWRDPPGRPARDYYRVELASGTRLWVCRLGFGAEARWFLQGRM